MLVAQPLHYTSKNKKAIERLEQAQNQYDLRNYNASEKLLKEALRADSDFIEAHLMLAQLYQVMGQVDNAILSAEEAMRINPDFFPNAHANLAGLYMSIGKYHEAKKYYESFLTYPKIREEVRKLTAIRIKSCDFALWAMDNPVPFTPMDLGPNVNGIYDDYWPSLSGDENTLVITVNVPRDSSNQSVLWNRQEDFYITTRDEEGNWMPIQNIGAPINTFRLNEGAQSLTADGKTMYYTVCEGRCNLFVSHLQENGKWGRPIKLPHPVNLGNSSEKQPSVSPDGSTLYFVSDRQGGFGSFDIWRSKKTGENSWSTPENLGETINTPYLEQSPFIHFDNQTLYFSSSGHVGMGGLDIYMTHMIDDTTWAEPTNLGYPINTHKNEDGLIVNARGTTAYFSSAINPKTGRDIYSFVLPDSVRPIPSTYVSGIISDAKTGWPLEAEFSLVDIDKNQTIMVGTSNDNGSFFLCVPANRRYAFFASTIGYLFYSDHFDLKGTYSADEPYRKNIELIPIKLGETLVMRNVFYATNSYELLPQSLSELEKLYELLNLNPTMQILVEGHTDNVGSESYNQTLSENRARSVVEYLVQRGIHKDRISSKGFGQSKPIDTNETEQGRAANRRTEIRVVKL